MQKAFSIVLVFMANCLLFSCTTKESDEDMMNSSCPAKNLSARQKEENNLFLKFYCGMPLEEYQKEERALINAGLLAKEVKSNSVSHTDSLTVFSLIVEDGDNRQEECIFKVSPIFEDDCNLRQISLDYLPKYHATASFIRRSSGEVSFEAREAPPEGTAENVEKLYKSKYGKSIVGGSNYLPEDSYDEHTWNLSNKTIILENRYGLSGYSSNKTYKRNKSINIKYLNQKFEKKLEIVHDSSSSVEKKMMLENVEKSRKSI